MKLSAVIRLLLIILVFHTGYSIAKEKPNIVFIVADDMGFNDVGFHSGDVRTPNIDALAGHGIILNRHYTLPCGTPSRAALMTAKHPIKTGVNGLMMVAGNELELPLEEKIFPQYFQDLGYKTHLVGKWHLGYSKRDHIPTRRGFDTFFGFYNGYLSYYDGIYTERVYNHGVSTNYSGKDFRRNEEPVWEEVYGKYLTDVLTKEAVTVIRNHDTGGLLLFLNHLVPHTGNLDLKREAPPITSNFTGRAIVADMVKYLDDSVGQVVQTLHEKGILNNTIIVFISDNGAATIDPIFNCPNFGSNWPLRGQKLSAHEGGVRTFAVVWNSSIKKPRVSSEYFHITDWLPTLYYAAGGFPYAFSHIDGINQWPSFVSNSPGPRREMLVDLDDQLDKEAYIHGNWKLIKNYGREKLYNVFDQYSGSKGNLENYDVAEVEKSTVGVILGKPSISYKEVRSEAIVDSECLDKVSTLAEDCQTKYCLYNIVADPSECTDLSARYPDVVEELAAKLHHYRTLVVQRKADGYFDPRADPRRWNGYWSPWLMDSGSSQLTISLFGISITLILITVNEIL